MSTAASHLVTQTAAIADLRSLRDRAQRINRTLVSDLKPFLHKVDRVSFRRLPDSKSKTGDVSVATTCSALMALSVTKQLGSLYGEKVKESVAQALTAMLAAKWDSSGLDEGNAFTTSLVLRAAGVLQSQGHAADALSQKRARKGVPAKSLQALGTALLRGSPSALAIKDYLPTPTIAYWLVDGCALSGIAFDVDAWVAVAEWATAEFSRQTSLIGARHEAMLDPVSMAMAACLVARLRRWAIEEGRLSDVETAKIPSDVELAQAVRLLFEQQRESGIWNKYFPLFHYPDAGANYCFVGELLEALFNEFGRAPVLQEEAVLGRIERSLAWFESNRLSYRRGQSVFSGWNSGGQVRTLEAGIPESWATAVVHMCVRRLDTFLSGAIDEQVRRHLRAEPPRLDAASKWDELIDVDVRFGSEKSTLLRVLKDNFIEQAQARKQPEKRSALLFGPPGTSKTTVVKRLAQEMRWPFVAVDPSHFLRHGFERLAPTSDDIFQMLFDLEQAVVFFDEMDPLVAERQAEQNFVKQAMTTVLLPKLAELYARRRVVFFMATNHLRGFDTAIRRPGRFDFLLCMGPPSWKRKLDSLKKKPATWNGRHGSDDELLKAHTKLQKWTKDDAATSEVLDRFTFGELSAFFDQLRDSASAALGSALDGVTQQKFAALVQEWGRGNIILSKDADGKTTAEWDEYFGYAARDGKEGYDGDLKKSRRQ